MKHFFTKLVSLLLLLMLNGCSGSSYPEGMSKTERKEYYAKYDNSKTAEEWQELRETREKTTTAREMNAGSVAFSIKNNSLLPKKLQIEGNLLSFGPLEKRFVGFPAETDIYLIKSRKGKKLLFTVGKQDEGKTLKF